MGLKNSVVIKPGNELPGYFHLNRRISNCAIGVIEL
jgi:hypothetical protein